MNLPSSLALPQSKFFQSRLGLLVLALVAVLIVGIALFFALRAPAPPILPTAATSPAAQAPVRTVAPTKVVVYGPPAPDWVPRDPVPAPAAAATNGAAGTLANGATATSAAGAANPAATAPGAIATGPAAAIPPSAATTPAATVATPAAVPVATVKVAEGAIPAPGVPVAGTAAGETPQSLDASVLFQREQYTYTSGGRRDPFESLIDGKYQSQSGDGSLVDVGDIHLVGIMWGSADKFALVEDSRGRGFVLRVGDPVLNGYISGISKTELQIVQNAFGDSQTMAIKLQPKEGDQNATRN
ncbi:MAG: hypothetical protein ACM3JJ_10605 [Hyphomicrobiales bacterium]